MAATKFLFPVTDQIVRGTQQQFDEAFKDSPHVVRVRPSDVFGQPVHSLAVTCGLCKSRSEANRLFESGAITLNHAPTTGKRILVESDLLEVGCLLLVRGKINYKVIKVDSESTGAWDP